MLNLCQLIAQKSLVIFLPDKFHNTTFVAAFHVIWWKHSLSTSFRDDWLHPVNEKFLHKINICNSGPMAVEKKQKKNENFTIQHQMAPKLRQIKKSCNLIGCFTSETREPDLSHTNCVM